MEQEQVGVEGGTYCGHGTRGRGAGRGGLWVAGRTGALIGSLSILDGGGGGCGGGGGADGRGGGVECGVLLVPLGTTSNGTLFTAGGRYSDIIIVYPDTGVH